jgi:hypothetical protein
MGGAVEREGLVEAGLDEGLGEDGARRRTRFVVSSPSPPAMAAGSCM